jgi:hypothetical protein
LNVHQSLEGLAEEEHSLTVGVFVKDTHLLVRIVAEGHPTSRKLGWGFHKDERRLASKLHPRGEVDAGKVGDNEAAFTDRLIPLLLLKLLGGQRRPVAGLEPVTSIVNPPSFWTR